MSTLKHFIVSDKNGSLGCWVAKSAEDAIKCMKKSCKSEGVIFEPQEPISAIQWNN